MTELSVIVNSPRRSRVIRVPSPRGPQGVAGESATSDEQIAEAVEEYLTEHPVGLQSYVHDQASASATWSITHPLDFRPNVTVVDTAGRVVEGQVDYIDATHITLSFNGAFAGKAYLS